LTVKIWPSVLCQNWFSFMGLASFGEVQEADKPVVGHVNRGNSPPKGLTFPGAPSNFAPFTAPNRPGRFPTGLPSPQ
jgi:hypothetical protein